MDHVDAGGVRLRHRFMLPGDFLRDENQPKEWNLALSRPHCGYRDLFHVKHGVASLTVTLHCAPDGGGGRLEFGPIRCSWPTVVHKVIHSDIHRSMHRYSLAGTDISVRRNVA